MRKVLSTAGVIAVVAAAGASAGCGQIGALKGKMAFKDANTLYAAQNYPAAARRYEEAIAKGCTADACNPPELAYSYFFLASSYDNMFKPAKRDDPANQELLKKAVQYYQKAADSSPTPDYKKRALQYLVAVHGPEKLNEPESAEPIVQKLIAMDPADTTNYYQMAKLYEDGGEFDRAEAQLGKARDVKPDDPDVYAQLAGFYERRGQFDKQMEALSTRAAKNPENPEAQHQIGATYWQKACLPSRPQCSQGAPSSDAVKAKYIAAGLEAENKAISLRDDYIDALVFKNLLLRSQAFLEKSAQRQKELLSEADALVAKVGEIRKRQQGQPAPAKKTE
jgi:tetratricopeptide (TPR) repeat protein